MIREGTFEDGAELAELAYDVLQDLYDVQEEVGANLIEQRKADLCYLIQQEGVPISYQYCYVFVEKKRICGAVWVYKTDYVREMLDNLDRLTLQKSLHVPKLRIEGEPNDYYIDTIVTHPEIRGMGVGGQLLDYVIEHHPADAPIGLMVACDKTRARSLYERKGFRFVKEKHIYDDTYYYLRRK